MALHSLVLVSKDIKPSRSNPAGRCFKVRIPTSVVVGKKKFYLNLNVYRNVNYNVLNLAKVTFNTEVSQLLLNIPPLQKISLHYKIYSGTNRSFDLDNASGVLSKFFQDSLVSSNILEDDNYKIIPKISFEYGGVIKNDPHCIVYIKEIF